MPDSTLLAQIDELQLRYVNALDEKDMEGWVACFDPEGSSYICIPLENVRQHLPLALMMDDSFSRIRDRAKFVQKVWAGTFEDYTTRHFVQRLTVQQGGDTATVRSNVMVAYTTAEGRSEVLATGQYLDEVRVRDGVAMIRSRRAIVDTVVTPRYLVYPI